MLGSPLPLICLATPLVWMILSGGVTNVSLGFEECLQVSFLVDIFQHFPLQNLTGIPCIDFQMRTSCNHFRKWKYRDVGGTVGTKTSVT